MALLSTGEGSGGRMGTNRFVTIPQLCCKTSDEEQGAGCWEAVLSACAFAVCGVDLQRNQSPFRFHST